MHLETFPGLQITLQVDGTDLQEYPDEDNETSDARSYVEMTPGSNFSISIKANYPFVKKDERDRILAMIYLDGTWTSTPIRDVPSSTVIDGARKMIDDKGVFRRFQFSELKTAETVHSKDVKHYSELGQIKLELYWARELYSFKENSAFDEGTEVTLPEKALKGQAISGRTSLAAPKEIKPFKYTQTELPYSEDSFAQFIFKYRTRKDLQFEGIIARSPSPVPLEDRDPETLTVEELRELARCNKEKRDALAKVKKERQSVNNMPGGPADVGNKRKRASSGNDSENGDDDDDDDDVEISFHGTRREAQRQRNAANGTNNEVIDLTD